MCYYYPYQSGKQEDWEEAKAEIRKYIRDAQILAGITRVLAEEKIGVFVIPTYNTDYVLVKEADFERSIRILKAFCEALRQGL